jgi:hypothetical protein
LLHEAGNGLAKSRIGIVLVTLSFPNRVRCEGLSALLARDLLVSILHDTPYEALREITPLLGSRAD